MLYERHIGEWETWHCLYLTGDETNRVFLSSHEAGRCWKRNGGEWRHLRGSYAEVLKPEVDAWLREVAGHRQGEVWECDRHYYPNEELPVLPSGGGHFTWREHFISYPDRDGSYHSYGWAANGHTDTSKQPGIRSYVSFHEGFIRSAHKAEHLPTIFAMMFL